MLENGEGPEQTPRSVASDLGLHCLLMSQKWDARLMSKGRKTEIKPKARLIWVKKIRCY